MKFSLDIIALTAVVVFSPAEARIGGGTISNAALAESEDVVVSEPDAIVDLVHGDEKANSRVHSNDVDTNNAPQQLQLMREEDAAEDRKLGWTPSYHCTWKGKGYFKGDWAYDCHAEYDKCQCVHNWHTGKYGWDNCRDDHHYCGGGDHIWKKYKNHACTFWGDGEEGYDFDKWYHVDPDWCEAKCEKKDNHCKAFDYDFKKDRCRIFYTYPSTLKYKDDLTCWKRKY